MIQNSFDGWDFTADASKTKNNTLNFENHSKFSEYDFEESSSKVGSRLGLCYSDDFIVNTVIPYLIDNTEPTAFKEKDVEKYAGKPMEFAKYVYGDIDYWWIILCVNGYLNPSEFHSFTKLIIPSKGIIESILNKESYNSSDLGEIPKSSDR